MREMLPEVKTLLQTDNALKNIPLFFYEVPETCKDTTFILIVPLGPIESSQFGNDKELSQVMTYQVNVESTNPTLAKSLQKTIKQLLFLNDFKQLEGGLDEYFNDTKRYVDARRYRVRTKLNDNDY